MLLSKPPLAPGKPTGVSQIYGQFREEKESVRKIQASGEEIVAPKNDEGAREIEIVEAGQENQEHN
jgi:hypothetical protein